MQENQEIQGYFGGAELVIPLQINDSKWQRETFFMGVRSEWVIFQIKVIVLIISILSKHFQEITNFLFFLKNKMSSLLIGLPVLFGPV